MAFLWDQRYSTGIAWQDEQHKEFIARINKLLDGLEKGTTADALHPMFNFLGEYIDTHFSAERSAMEKTAYPDAPAHLAEHDNFVTDYAQMRRELLDGASPVLLATTMRKMTSWLLYHIGDTDRRLARHLLAAQPLQP